MEEAKRFALEDLSVESIEIDVKDIIEVYYYGDPFSDQTQMRTHK